MYDKYNNYFYSQHKILNIISLETTSFPKASGTHCLVMCVLSLYVKYKYLNTNTSVAQWAGDTTARNS